MNELKRWNCQVKSTFANTRRERGKRERIRERGREREEKR